jgi:hypothetical protein
MTGNYLSLYSALYSDRYSAQHDAPSSTSARLQYVTPSGVSSTLASHHAIRSFIHQAISTVA